MSEPTLDELHSEIQSLHATLDLRLAAEKRAVAMWQERTGKNLVWPGHADLCVWLMDMNKLLAEQVHEGRDHVRKFASGICSAHHDPLPECPTCNLRLSLPGLIEGHKQAWLEQVKPIAEALESVYFAHAELNAYDHEFCERSGAPIASVKSALAKARKLGLLEDKP